MSDGSSSTAFSMRMIASALNVAEGWNAPVVLLNWNDTNGVSVKHSSELLARAGRLIDARPLSLNGVVAGAGLRFTQRMPWPSSSAEQSGLNTIAGACATPR